MLPNPIAGMDMVKVVTFSKPCFLGLLRSEIPKLRAGGLIELLGVFIAIVSVYSFAHNA